MSNDMLSYRLSDQPDRVILTGRAGAPERPDIVYCEECYLNEMY